MTDPRADALQAVWQAIHLYKLESGKTIGEIIVKGNDKINLCNLALDAAWNTRPQPPAPQDNADLLDEIAEAISDTLDMDWQPSWAAPNILALINREKAPIIAERDAALTKLALEQELRVQALHEWSETSEALRNCQAKLAAAEAVLRKWLAYDDCDSADFSTASPMLLYATAINATRTALATEKKP